MRIMKLWMAPSTGEKTECKLKRSPENSLNLPERIKS